MSGIGFERLQTNLKTLFSRVSLANWFSTIFSIFICSFPDIHLFLINYNLFRFRNRLWTFSTHFYSFSNCFCSFFFVYQSFLLVSTCLPFTRCFCSFTSRFYSFILIYQTFLLVDQTLPILVLTQGPCATSNINTLSFISNRFMSK